MKYAKSNFESKLLTTATVPTVDLDAMFGDQYRIGWEADAAPRSEWPAEERVWLRQLRCKYGVVAPFGRTVLQAVVLDHPKIGARLRRLPCILTARGDVETVVTFDVKDIAEVFAVLKPYRRRQLSAEQRAALVARLRGAQKPREAPCECEYSEQEATQQAGGYLSPVSGDCEA